MKASLVLFLCALPCFGGLTYKRSIVIDHSKTGSADLTDFPVLVKLSGSTFRSAANGGHVRNESGFDVAFFSDIDLTTTLAWEIDSFDSQNGTLTAWVRIPQVSHTADTTFYVGYGDPTIGTSQNSGAAVWDSNFRAVYHLNEPAAGDSSTLADSTSNHITLTANGTGASAPFSVTGVVGQGLSMPHRGQYAGATATSTANAGIGAGNSTIEGWFNLNSIFSSDGNVTFLFGTPAITYPYGINALYVNSSGQFLPYVGGDALNGPPTAQVTAGAWHHVAFTYDHSVLRMYLDGLLSGSLAAAVSTYESPIRLNSSSAYYSDARYDELRISSSARSPDWILAEFNNQSSAETFSTVGPESPASGTTPATPHLSGQPIIF